MKGTELGLEELRAMKRVSNTDGRPPFTMTDERWQKEFAIRKMYVKPYKDGRKLMKSQRSMSKDATYDGETNFKRYTNFINDVLHNIRSGNVDYCFYIYQITELLKFHHDDLRTRYIDGYWEVWLEG